MPDHTIHATSAELATCPRYHCPAEAVPVGQQWNCQAWDGLGRFEVKGTGVPVPDMGFVAEALRQIRAGDRPERFEQCAALADRVEQLEAELATVGRELDAVHLELAELDGAHAELSELKDSIHAGLTR